MSDGPKRDSRRVRRTFYGADPPADPVEGDLWVRLPRPGNRPRRGRPSGQRTYPREWAEDVFEAAVKALRGRGTSLTITAIAVEVGVDRGTVTRWIAQGWVSIPPE